MHDAVEDDLRWHRIGGHSVSFFTTEAELDTLVTTSLRNGDHVWTATGADLVPDPGAQGRFLEQPFSEPLSLLSRFADNAKGRRTNVFLWSPSRSRAIRPESVTGRYEAACSLSGHILVQRLTRERSTAGLEVSIMHVTRVVDSSTGEERRYTDYKRVYDRLKRSVSARVVCGTRRSTRAGEQFEDSTWKWTGEAVQAFESGVGFSAVPASAG